MAVKKTEKSLLKHQIFLNVNNSLLTTVGSRSLYTNACVLYLRLDSGIPRLQQCCRNRISTYYYSVDSEVFHAHTDLHHHRQYSTSYIRPQYVDPYTFKTKIKIVKNHWNR